MNINRNIGLFDFHIRKKFTRLIASRIFNDRHLFNMLINKSKVDSTMSRLDKPGKLLESAIFSSYSLVISYPIGNWIVPVLMEIVGMLVGIQLALV